MRDFNNILKLKDNELVEILNYRGEEQKELWECAVNIRNKTIGNKVFARGIVEFSNICQKNCYYCGIRSGNPNVKRYFLNVEEIMPCVDFIVQSNIPSIVLQSGEQNSDNFKEYLKNIIKTIKSKYKKLSITLSCGELDYEYYKELNELGANRYLLRIESSNRKLYEKLHPTNHSYENRYKCLQDLRRAGYQVGCGNMVGTPYSTDFDFVSDLRFFVGEDFDMFGLGPYIIHRETPLATEENIENWEKNKESILNKTLNLIAMLRIATPTANIAAATALDVIAHDGRTLALKAGANVIMPSITPKANKKNYFLYSNKPNVDDDYNTIIKQMENKVKLADMEVAYGVEGHSLHYKMRTKTYE